MLSLAKSLAVYFMLRISRISHFQSPPNCCWMLAVCSGRLKFSKGWVVGHVWLTKYNYLFLICSCIDLGESGTGLGRRSFGYLSTHACLFLVARSVRRLNLFLLFKKKSNKKNIIKYLSSRKVAVLNVLYLLTNHRLRCTFQNAWTLRFNYFKRFNTY